MKQNLRIAGITLSGIAIATLGLARDREPAGDELAPAFSVFKNCAHLLHPEGGKSPSELLSTFERPSNRTELLRNLKKTWDRDLLLEPAFYSEDVLQKVFASGQVTWKPSEIARATKSGYVRAELSTDAKSGVSAEVEGRCSRNDYKQPIGSARADANIFGILRVTGSAVAGMTLMNVREVFGPETQNDLDSGISDHGDVYTPTEKGEVTYVRLENPTSPEFVRTAQYPAVTFRFKLRTAHSGGEKRNEILSDDVVQSIQIVEIQRRLLEK